MTADDRDEDEDLLAAWFDAFFDDALEGRFTDIDALIERRPDLEDRIREAQIRAHQLAGRRLPTTPRVDGYEIVRELGRGGMGAVFLARSRDRGRLVALKVLPSSFGLSDRARARFLGEARALAQVSGEHVVRIHNVIANDEALAFEMEYVDGPTLRDVAERLRIRGREASLSDVAAVLGDGAVLRPERTLLQWCVRIAATIARALADVHRVGLVHRDVKPSNILLRRDGTPLLADFGLVRDLASSATRTDAFVGTLNYAAPEQLRADSDACDARSDVYSLAATLWELLVGAPPHQARSAVDALRRIEARGAPRLRQELPDAPRDLETILEKALEPDPAQRYPTADALADDLDLLLRWRPIRARAPGGLARAARQLRRHRRTLTAAVLGAALLGIAVAVPAWLAAEQERRVERADALAREARAALVSRATRERAYRQIALGIRPEFERVRQLGDDRDSDLQRSLRALQDALELVPGRPADAEDALLIAIADGAIGPDGAALDLTSLPPTVRAYATPWAEGGIDYGFDPARLEGATRDERRAIGLLAFLTGDVVNCEAAWSGLDPVATEAPLTDAGLGLLYAADGLPERAYPRLLQAIRTFPDNPVLAVTLAEVAVALGDADLGARWVDRATELGADPADVAVARADLRRAQRDVAGSRAALADLDPSSPRVGLRLARLEIDAGDVVGARARLDALVARDPSFVAARVELGRLALGCADRAAYLAQVEWVADAGFCAQRSPGTIRCVVDLLRCGGLHQLAECAAAGTSGAGMRGVWTDASLPRVTFADPARIEALVLRRRDFARDLRSAFPRPLPHGRLGRAAEALARTVAALSWFPELTAAWNAEHRAAAGWVAIAVRGGWGWIVGDLLPRVLGSEDACASLGVRALHREQGRAGDLLGNAAAAGDVDADGVADYLCGTYRDPVDGPGFLRAVSGRTGEVLVEIRGLAVGFSFASVGDFDRDGHDDFAHTEVLPDPDGTMDARVLVRSGRSGAMLLELRDPHRTVTFGTAIVAVGDVDGDGRTDLAVGSMGAVGGVGFVRVHAGATGAEIATAYGPRGASFGVSLTTVSDRDGDGHRDLLVGAMGAAGAHGRAWILSSRSGAALHELTGGPECLLFGTTVASGADLDGDGIEDFAVGAGAGAAGGTIVVFSGADLARLASIGVGMRGGAGLGTSVALGDVDGDGIADVVGGISKSNASGPAAGRILAWSGRSIRDGVEPRRIVDLCGDVAAAEVGAGLALLHDHFGPGFAALVVTAPGWSAPGPRSGAAWLVSPVLDAATARARLDARR